MASADVLVAVLEEGREKQVRILCDGDADFSLSISCLGMDWHPINPEHQNKVQCIYLIRDMWERFDQVLKAYVLVYSGIDYRGRKPHTMGKRPTQNIESSRYDR